jgi:hypothetical protein
MVARDPATFAKVSNVMLGEAIPSSLPRQMIIAEDAFAFADLEVAAASQSIVERLRTLIGDAREMVMAPAGIVQWARAERTLQPSEAWLTFKDWIERENPRFAYSVARDIFTGSQIPETERQWAQLVRQEARGRMRHLLAPGTILCLPTTPFPAPQRGAPLGRKSAARPDFVPVRPWRTDECATSEYSLRHGGWIADWLIDRRRAGQRHNTRYRGRILPKYTTNVRFTVMSSTSRWRLPADVLSLNCVAASIAPTYRHAFA